MPISETLIPPIGAGLTDIHRRRSGRLDRERAGLPPFGVTVTARLLDAAALPKLSVVLIVIVSAAVEPSSSVSVVRSAFTCASVPLIVSVVPPFDGVIVPPLPVAEVVADNTPQISDSTAVNVSPRVSYCRSPTRQTPATAVAWFCCTVAVAGPRSPAHRSPSPSIEAAVALAPLLSLALTVIVSAVVEASLSVSVVRSAFTCASVPLMVSVLPPFDGVIVPPPPVADVVADSTPLVSDSMAVNVSPDVVDVSETTPMAPTLV